MKSLQTVFSVAYDEITKAGITTLPPKTSISLKYSRGRKTLGSCSKLSSGRYQISISKYITTSYKAVKITMIHEILHTAKDCMNHGATWQRHADKVNRTYGYSISRVANMEELGLAQMTRSAFKYKITCCQCSTAFYRIRESKLIQYPYLYRCGKCGGDLTVTRL